MLLDQDQDQGRRLLQTRRQLGKSCSELFLARAGGSGFRKALRVLWRKVEATEPREGWGGCVSGCHWRRQDGGPCL